MNSHTLRGLSISAVMAGAVALNGCGGSGGGSMSGTMTPVDPPQPPEPPSPTLTVPTGMTASSAPGVTARSAGDTIAALLPRPDRAFAPVSAKSRIDEFHVKAISSDGNDGFRVTYVVAGRERTVHFEADDYGTADFQTDYYTETEDGGRFWLNSLFGSFSEEDKNEGSPYFEYLDIYGSGVNSNGARNRQHLTFGARTDAANLPTGTASYSGLLTAENHPSEFTNLDTRGRLWGNWRLTAKFSQSTLGGDIRLARVRGPNDSEIRYLPYTTYFRIENGQIVDGRFTASVSGVDSNPSAPADRTLSGFEGDMLGEFYGPGAEEAGGVMRAARASDNRVLVGSFGGKRMPELDPSLPDGNLSLLSVGVDRDYIATTVQLSDDVEVTAIERDAASGFHVTYRVDGTDYRVHLAEQIYFNRYDLFGLFNHQAAGMFAFSDQTGSFFGTPEFSYFDVHGWAVLRHGVSGPTQSVHRGFVVSGVSTEATDLPAGAASYEGRVHFEWWQPGFPRIRDRLEMAGRFNLSANFDESTVGGSINQLTGELYPVTSIAIENGAISGSEFTADLRGVHQGVDSFNGGLGGRFYGPAAGEVAGVLNGRPRGTGQNDPVVQGWFGGTKQ